MVQKYLTKSRHGIYYFQYWIPKLLSSPTFKSKIFRFSLKTTIKRDAVKLSYRYIVLLNCLEENYRNSPKGFCSELLIMKDKINETNNQIEQGEIDYNHGLDIKSKLKGIDLHSRSFGTQEYLTQLNLTQYDMDCYQLIVDEQSATSVDPEQTSATIESLANELLSECLELFISEKQVNWTGIKGGRTEETVRTKITAFIDLLGDKPASQLTKEDSKTFKSLMLKFPKNKNKLKRYRDKSFKDILSMNIPDEDIASDVTRSGYLKQVSSFLGWLIDNDYTKINGIQVPLRGVFKGGGSADQEVDAFDDQDLKKLFENNYYFRRMHRTPSKYWTPLIGLFSGARLNEICQLYKSDIAQKDGIWYFDINDNTDDKHLKKPYHARQVPIHKQLIKLGFLDYVKEIKTKRIFPELKYDDKRYYQKSISAWFRVTYKKNCNVGQRKDEKKVFHSFRHTFITYLVNDLEISQPKIARLVGQKPVDGSVTTGRYAKNPKLEDTNKIIQRIKWNIDFSKIRQW